MNRGTIQSIGIFAAIAIVLLALVIGGVRLFKDRNAQYASRAGQNTQSGQQQAPEKPQSQPPQATTPAQPSPTPQATSQPTQPNPTQTPAPQQPSSSTPAQVPQTGPAEDTMATIVLMMLAAYFAFVLKRAKVSYRRLLS